MAYLKKQKKKKSIPTLLRVHDIEECTAHIDHKDRFDWTDFLIFM